MDSPGWLEMAREEREVKEPERPGRDGNIMVGSRTVS